MERAPRLQRSVHVFTDWSWRRLWLELLPVAAVVAGAFLLARDLAGGGNSTPPLAMVGSAYEARLAANIEFFETRVQETHDSLSYNRLTSLYLERLRLTADAADVTRAELAATTGLEAAPNSYASVTAMAQVRLAQHDFRAAMALLDQAEALKAGVPETLALRGDALMALGRYDEAGSAYRQFLDTSPGFSAFSRQAVFAETYGNVDVAVQFWQAAIDAAKDESPLDSAWARVQLGNLLATNGRLDDASEQLSTALRVYPGYALALAGEGRVAAMRGDYKKAEALYQQAVAKLPSPEFVAPLVDVAAAAGDTAEASRQAALMGAIGQLFEANGIRNDLTLILFRLDHGQAGPETLAAAQAAYEDRPSLAAADVYGWALYRAGQFEEAAKYSAEAVRLRTREPLYLFHAGTIARALGDFGDARTLLGESLSLNSRFHPQFATEAKNAQEMLEAAR